jgi:hypothetical protein
MKQGGKSDSQAERFACPGFGYSYPARPVNSNALEVDGEGPVEIGMGGQENNGWPCGLSCRDQAQFLPGDFLHLVVCEQYRLFTPVLSRAMGRLSS